MRLILCVTLAGRRSLDYSSNILDVSARVFLDEWTLSEPDCPP